MFRTSEFSPTCAILSKVETTGSQPTKQMVAPGPRCFLALPAAPKYFKSLTSPSTETSEPHLVDIGALLVYSLLYHIMTVR